MAIVRTVLPRKGIIQPKHGDNYETDLDTNWMLIDSLLQDSADVQSAIDAAGMVETWLNDRGVCGVVSGFTLTTSATLTPGLVTGVLYAQGKRYAPSEAPNPGPAPASSTSYLFYNSASGFYYNLTGIAAATGDAFLGSLVSDSTHVTAVTNATKLYAQVAAAPGAAGSFALAHRLGRIPAGAVIQMTSAGAIWFQSPTLYDSTNLYLAASDAGVTAKVLVW
ncbi:MAG: hypothetical protein LAN62_14960 [Acidobacteriia bacterium]|nr:hypothetical protein [Terriglobia bacterium]